MKVSHYNITVLNTATGETLLREPRAEVLRSLRLNRYVKGYEFYLDGVYLKLHDEIDWTDFDSEQDVKALIGEEKAKALRDVADHLEANWARLGTRSEVLKTLRDRATLLGGLPKFWTGQLWWTGSSLVEITHIAKDGLMQAKLYHDLEFTTRDGFFTPRVTCLPEETNGWTLVLKGLPTDDWDAAFAKYLVAKYPLNKETATTSTVVAPK